MDQNTTPAPVAAATTPALDSLGTLLQQSWKLYIDRFVHLATVMLIPGLLGMGLMWASDHFFFASDMPLTTEVVALVALAMILLLVLGAWSQVALAMMVIAPEEASITGVLKESFRKILSYFWISCLACLVVTAGFVLLVLPGIFFGVTLIFTTFFLVSENMSGRDALAQSYMYVMGHWWPIFGRIIVLGIIVIGVSSLATLIPGGSQGEVGSLVGNVITMPFVIAYIYVLYKNVKAIKSVPSPEVLAKKKKMFSLFAALGILGIFVLVGALLFALYLMGAGY